MDTLSSELTYLIVPVFNDFTFCFVFYLPPPPQALWEHYKGALHGDSVQQVLNEVQTMGPVQKTHGLPQETVRFKPQQVHTPQLVLQCQRESKHTSDWAEGFIGIANDVFNEGTRTISKDLR